MKKCALMLLAGCLALAACRSEADRIREFMPGSYVCSAKSEFSLAWDTLVVSADPAAERTYQVVRRTGYRLLKAGQPGALRLKVKRWTAIFDEGTGQLTVLQTGKVLRFLPARHGLINGSSLYRKL